MARDGDGEGADGCPDTRTGRTRGRRPGGENPDARTEILSAARTCFEDSGYLGTSLRGVAKLAQCDVSLVSYYFGTKEQLFAAALDLPVSPPEVVRKVLLGDLREMGESATRIVLEQYADPDLRTGLQGVVQSAAARPGGWRVLRDFYQTQVIEPLAVALGGDEQARRRATLVVTHLAGLAIARYVMRFAPLEDADTDELAEWVGPVIQHYLTGDLGVSPADSED